MVIDVVSLMKVENLFDKFDKNWEWKFLVN